MIIYCFIIKSFKSTWPPSHLSMIQSWGSPLGVNTGRFWSILGPKMPNRPKPRCLYMSPFLSVCPFGLVGCRFGQVDWRGCSQWSQKEKKRWVEDTDRRAWQLDLYAEKKKKRCFFDLSVVHTSCKLSSFSPSWMTASSAIPQKMTGLQMQGWVLCRHLQIVVRRWISVAYRNAESLCYTFNLEKIETKLLLTT